MMRSFRVDTAQMTGAVGGIQSAAERLGELKERLDGINGRLQSSATMSQGSDADNKIDDFRKRWKDEFGIVADMLSKFTEALTSAADAYDGADEEIARVMQAEGGTPPAAGV